MKRRITLTALVSSLAVLLAVLLTGCSAAHGGSISSSLSQRSELPLESASVPSGAQVQDTASYITPEDARQIALGKAGISADGVRWEDKEFDLDDGTPVYELEFSKDGTEYDCDVHAITGKVLDFDFDRDGDNAPSTPAKPEVTEPAKPDYIGLDKAKEIALGKAGISADGVRWENCEADLDDGTPIYELEFSKDGTEYECDVHAITGKVLNFETDRDDAWDDRDDDDDDDEDEWDD